MVLRGILLNKSTTTRRIELLRYIPPKDPTNFQENKNLPSAYTASTFSSIRRHNVHATVASTAHMLSHHSLFISFTADREIVNVMLINRVNFEPRSMTFRVSFRLTIKMRKKVFAFYTIFIYWILMFSLVIYVT